MGILVATAPLPAAPYAEALRRAAPDIPVWLESDAPPAEAVEAMLAWRLKPGMVPAWPKLRVVCSVAAGVDKLLSVPDLPPDLPVTRVVDPNQAVEIAQYVVAQVLRHTRDLDRYAALQRAGTWERHPVRPAARCRVGLLGIGQVGQAIARAFQPLGYPVSAWSRRGASVAGVRSFAGAAALGDFLAQADVLVCTLPLTDETRGLLNRQTLAQLPRGAFVVNVGRGEQMVEPDLRALLDEGHLAGAALDVFEREPILPDNWVWQHPRVSATPHIAAAASFDEVARQCIDSLRRLRTGQRPLHEVDRAAGY